MKKLLFVLALSLLSVSSDAATILVFGQSTGLNLATGNEVAGTTILDSNNVPVTITTLNESGVNLSAFFNWEASSIGSAINTFGDTWIQFYSGEFHITSGINNTGFNFLSGIFTGVQLGIVGGHTFVFGSSEPVLDLTFTSDIPGIPLLVNPAMALSLTNVLPGISIVNNSFADFDANLSGTFSAEVIPEAGTFVLLMTGLFGLTLMRRR